jgi:hypothetical protein
VVLATGVLLVVIGLGSLGFGLFAMLRGGRGQRGGGIGPISERGIHVLAGIRMLLIGLVSLIAGLYLLLG